MKKRNIIIISILIIGIIILSIYFYIRANDESFNWHPCLSESYNEAQEKLDIAICENVPNEPGSSKKNPYYDNYCREKCIKEIAYEKGDSQLCELINNFQDIPHVEGWDDPRETGSIIDYCYIHLAKKLNDNSLCDNVETEWAQEHCPF